jgi:uncharacterized protein (TIGR02284 family)
VVAAGTLNALCIHMNVSETQSSSDLQRVAAILNACIEVCIDGHKMYAVAAANVRKESFKRLLQEQSDRRADFVIQLQRALVKMGLTPENEGTLRGEARRSLMEARHALELVHHDDIIVQMCVRDEEAALRQYTSAVHALEHAKLSVDLRVLLDEHFGSVRRTLEEARALLE